MTDMDDMDAKLDAIVPVRPKTKQAIVDAWLPKIEERMKQGVSLEQMNEVIFQNEISVNYFAVMLTRARKKRDNKTGTDGGAAASPRPAPRPDSPSAESRAPRGGSVKKPSPAKSSAVAASLSGGQASPAPAADEGEGAANGELTSEERELLSSKKGEFLESQDDRLPPPSSTEPVGIDDVPADLPHYELLRMQPTWLAVHYYLRTFFEIERGERHNPFSMTDPNTLSMDKLLETDFPRAQRWKSHVTNLNKNSKNKGKKLDANAGQMEM